MMRCLSFVLFLLLSAPLHADEIAIKDNASHLSLPTCDDKKLHELLTAKISEYYQKHSAVSQLEKRMQKLISRSMKHFNEVDVASFSPQDNIYVANKLMSIKINDGLENKEIRLCRTTVVPNLPIIYLLIYPDNYYYMVDIINFEGTPSNREFFVIYD